MMWMTIAGLSAFILGWQGMVQSEKIKSDDGEWYRFSPSYKLGTAILSCVMTTRLTYVAPSKIEWLLLLVIGVLLSLQCMIDFKYQELANEWSLGLAIASIALMVFQGQSLWGTRLISWLVLTTFFFLWWAFSSGLGFGDVKLIAATSFLLTTDQIIPYLITVLSVAILYGVGVMVIKKKGLKTEFAFGPFLILGLLLIGFV